MIYTVTFNPSLDYIVDVDNFTLGVTNRTTAEKILAGGKGINVSHVLRNFGVESTAFGFLAGFVGDEIKRRVEKEGIVADFILLPEGTSRINIKIKNIDGTEINAQGPDIPKEEVAKLREKLQSLNEEDMLVLAGSIPASLPGTIYQEIMEELEKKNIRIVVDATKALLLPVLKYHPFLVKPNHQELGDVFGVRLSTRQEVIPYAVKLKEMGAENVLVSIGAFGAVLVDETGKIHEGPAPVGKVVNAVGAGDSMVAGFLAGYLQSGDYSQAFQLGIASGSASAFSELLATKEEILSLAKSVEQKSYFL